MYETDLAIIGAGIAGCTTAIYAARKRTQFLLITEKFGGRFNESGKIFNYPGIKEIAGFEFSQRLKEQLKFNKIPISEEKAESIKKGHFCQKEADHHWSKTNGMLASLWSASLDSQKFHQKRQDYWSSNHQSKTGGISVIKINCDTSTSVPGIFAAGQGCTALSKSAGDH